MPPQKVDPRLANALRAIREQRTISQERTALNAELTTGSLSRIERGVANPRWTTVLRLADALNVNLVQLAETIEATSS